ncbi:aminoglycoside phosphotransferase family protein [Luteolibacter yonseiensis]|uniref:Aminoglycoside phosphotransferase family protein n=1 Tax=Luteolibacter yonseiensis TaxID=1144680 RepID=A0A934V8H1_9BACT|nr:aminoglycoside phosphotransferase family protein [Luteolibacter yonseiensis]
MPNLREIFGQFDVRADYLAGISYGSGHINDTYCVTVDQAGRKNLRYIFQRINKRVFKNPAALMENIGRVTRHSLERLREEDHPEAHRRTLTCIPALTGKPYAVDANDDYWRVYPFIEGATGHDEIKTNEQAFQAARAFGNFQKLAAGLGGGRLHETIPDFHDTPKRLDALRKAVEADAFNRAAGVKAEIDFALARASDCARITGLIATGEIPERVTHNDTKLNNVLLDDVTAEGVCVIDLDTTMPGSALYDFGDMVRTAATSHREDSTDTGNLEVRLDRFEALVRGYLDSTRSFLTPAELDHLAFSGKLLTLECGIRFLTDHLQGDIYFKTKHPTHNLDRCRNQFTFVAAIERNLSGMEAMVASHSCQMA